MPDQDPTLSRIREAVSAALDHIIELEEAWLEGRLSENDGQGGTRSNRNVTVRNALKDALALLASPSARDDGWNEAVAAAAGIADEVAFTASENKGTAMNIAMVIEHRIRALARPAREVKA